MSYFLFLLIQAIWIILAKSVTNVRVKEEEEEEEEELLFIFLEFIYNRIILYAIQKLSATSLIISS